MAVNFEQLRKQLDALDLGDVVKVAKAQGIEIPAEVLAEVALDDFITGIKDGSKNDENRSYLQTKGFSIDPEANNGRGAFARGLYMEVRALDELCQLADAGLFHRMRDMARAKGYNTAPAPKAKK